ncbi:hypothetical protein [Legionella resiliens]|uniref:Uncharacterized protein n=1 Tax=Legionella resiliens TaxID=2905958 RepID=A0ABS8X1T9_9GAMM|nr:MULTISPECIES: hypothetical protein [unclassified Legionella]MCE0721889.1 hypothetical protein [Legionella sp. 9fVS26]MCE3531043.1 hypothetical protein [Legionella sp. 8cVS16]
MPSQLKSHDELSSIDSAIKIDQLLNDIKKLIDECESDKDLKLIVNGYPHLVPIMIGHYGSVITKKFNLIPLGYLFNLNYDFSLFFFNSSIWEKLASTDKAKLYLSTNIPSLKKVREAIDLAISNQDKEEEERLTLKLKRMMEELTAPGFNFDSESIFGNSLNWFAEEYEEEFKELGRYYLDLILNINQGTIFEFLNQTTTANNMPFTHGLAAYVFCNSSMITNAIREVSDFLDAYSLNVNAYNYTDNLIRLIVNHEHLMVKLFDSYRVFSKIDPNGSREFSVLHKALLEKMRATPNKLLRFVENEEQFQVLHTENAKKARFQFPSFEQFTRDILVTSLKTHPHLRDEITQIQHFLDGDATVDCYFGQTTKTSAAYQLLRLVIYPESINQGNANICGAAVFLKVLMNSYPDFTIRMLINFISNGEVCINGKTIANNDYYESNNLLHAFLVALRHSSNRLGYLPGLPKTIDFAQGSTPNFQVISWLQTFGFNCTNASYHTYTNGKPLGGIYTLFFHRTDQRSYTGWEENFTFVLDAMQKQPNAKFILGVSAGLTHRLCKHAPSANKGDASILGIAADHWVELTNLAMNDDDTVDVTVFTYGDYYHCTLPKEKLLDGWRGAIIASPENKPELSLESDTETSSAVIVV